MPSGRCYKVPLGRTHFYTKSFNPYANRLLNTIINNCYIPLHMVIYLQWFILFTAARCFLVLTYVRWSVSPVIYLPCLVSEFLSPLSHVYGLGKLVKLISLLGINIVVWIWIWIWLRTGSMLLRPSLCLYSMFDWIADNLTTLWVNTVFCCLLLIWEYLNMWVYTLLLSSVP